MWQQQAKITQRNVAKSSKGLNPRSKSFFSIAIKARGCSIFFLTLNILNGYLCFYEVRCYWKHLWNLKNMLETHWEHNGNTLWTTKNPKNPRRPTPSPQKNWYGIKLKCYWEHLGYLKKKKKLKIHWEFNGIMVETHRELEKSNAPYTHSKGVPTMFLFICKIYLKKWFKYLI